MFWPRPTILRPLITLSNIILWCSSAVVLFLLAHLVQNFEGGGPAINPSAPTIVAITIAGASVLSAVVGLMLSTRLSYRGRMLPIDMALSYLWLAASLGSDIRREQICAFAPVWCERMRTAEAFSWIAFGFTISNISLEALLYGWYLVPNEQDVLPPAGVPLSDKRSGAAATTRHSTTSPAAASQSVSPTLSPVILPAATA